MSYNSPDYLLRMLEDMNKMVARVMKKDLNTEDMEFFTNEAGDHDMLSFVLKGLLMEGKIDPAENLLFRFSELAPTKELFRIGLDFYQDLESWNEEKLAQSGWTEEEIKEGLRDFIALFPPEERDRLSNNEN